MNIKLIRQLAYNAVFLGAIWLGAWHSVQPVGWAVIAFVWVMALSYFSALYVGKLTTEFSDPLPRGVGWGFDVVCVFMFIHADWHVTATVYVLSVMALELVYLRSKKNPRNPNSH